MAVSAAISHWPGAVPSYRTHMNISVRQNICAHQRRVAWRLVWRARRVDFAGCNCAAVAPRPNCMAIRHLIDRKTCAHRHSINGAVAATVKSICQSAGSAELCIFLYRFPTFTLYCPAAAAAATTTAKSSKPDRLNLNIIIATCNSCNTCYAAQIDSRCCTPII